MPSFFLEKKTFYINIRKILNKYGKNVGGTNNRTKMKKETSIRKILDYERKSESSTNYRTKKKVRIDSVIRVASTFF